MNLVGTVLAGRYEIVEEIGSGGMAIVYKAKCRILNRYVAIKVLRTDLKDDGEFVRRFNIEAQSAASLTHPNIVSIYDVGTEGELHYIVMEYVEGTTLKEYIDKNVLLNWHEAVGYAIQIASGLEQAHKNSIVHRDIKPHNIIMTNDGVLKITDFGIARASMQSTVTCEDNAIGSVHYVSPEQARGGYVDERSDIYSLGIVLYEMLTGKVPFDNESPVSIALMHLQTQPKPPRELNISIPKAVEDIVLKAMSKEVAARYKTITEIKNELTAVAESGVSTPVAVADNVQSSKTDDLGGTAIFTAAKDIPSSAPDLPNNQAPSANSNLTPTPYEEKDYEAAPDIDIIDDEDDEEDYFEEDTDMATRKSAQKKNKTNIIVIAAALFASALIIWGVIAMVGPYISSIFGSSEKTVKVPQFVNMQYDVVMEEYSDSEYFEFTYEFDENPDEEDGFILEQSPSPGTDAVFKDDKILITLTVNKIDKDKGTDELKDYVGMDYNKVKKELSALDISIKLKYEFDDSYDEDFIIAQSEEEGTLLEDIDTLTLTISKGEDNDKPDDKTDEGKDPSGNNDEGNNQTEDNPPQVANRKRLTIYGPTSKDSAKVDVKVNGKTIKSLELSRGASDVVTIQSSLSSVNVEIFHDGVLVLTQTVKMTD